MQRLAVIDASDNFPVLGTKKEHMRGIVMNAFYEFFAGGGMVRAGLGLGWRCLFANDSDPKKAAAYRANWGDGEMTVSDVRDFSLNDLPGRADLA